MWPNGSWPRGGITSQGDTDRFLGEGRNTRGHAGVSSEGSVTKFGLAAGDEGFNFDACGSDTRVDATRFVEEEMNGLRGQSFGSQEVLFKKPARPRNTRHPSSLL